MVARKEPCLSVLLGFGEARQMVEFSVVTLSVQAILALGKGLVPVPQHAGRQLERLDRIISQNYEIHSK